MDNQLSIYTPSNTKPEILEEILVQRHKLLDRSVAWCAESLITAKKNHLLFIGPRGSGKTHMVSMIVNRLREKKELEDKMLIVWLGEDDIVTNFLDLVLSILRYLAKEYDFSLECLEEAKGLKSDKAANIMLECINEQLDGRKILLIKENLSDVFNGLKDIGQKQLRAYLQEQKNMVLLATSQQLFKGVSSRDAVFFGFFDIHYLKPLSVDDAMKLIERVSALKGDEELRRFVKTPQGRYRVRALHHLAGGNQRLYMDLLSFLTKESLDDLVSALNKLADDLTPYFQERIKSLAPQQGLIVQKLCEIEGAISVKDLAEEMFIGERSVAKQLGDLKEKGYVLAHKRGKLTYYEISEPLMRLSLQVKHTRGKPLKILVLLLRAWYSDDELKVYEKIKSNTLLEEYAKSAYLVGTDIIEKINNKANNELSLAFDKSDNNKIVEICSDVIASPSVNKKEDIEKCNAYFVRGNVYGGLKEYGMAIIDFTNALEVSEENNDLHASILLSRAFAYGDSNQVNLAINDYKCILNFKQLEYGIKNETMYHYAEFLAENKNYKLALDIYIKFIKFDNITEKNKQQALVNMGDIYSELMEYDKAIKVYLKILKMEKLYIERELLFAQIILNYMVIEEYTKAKVYAEKVFKLQDIDVEIEKVVRYLYVVALFNVEEYEKVIKLSQNILDKYEEDEIKSGTLLMLTTIFYHSHEIEKARNYLLQWKKCCQDKSIENLSNLNNILVAICTNSQKIWATETPFILEIVNEKKEMEYLGKALINSINYFINTVEDIAQFKNWQLLWEEVGAEYEYLQPALKALKATRLAVEEKSDKPLFALPKEIRELVLPMVEEAIKE